LLVGVVSTEKAMMTARWTAEELNAARPNTRGENPILLQCGILPYELGDLIKCAMNTYWGGIRGYQGEAGLALADVITQLRLLACHLDLDFWGALREGEERYMERMEQLRNRTNGYEDYEPGVLAKGGKAP
jgi:hypothetical protein